MDFTLQEIALMLGQRDLQIAALEKEIQRLNALLPKAPVQPEPKKK